MSNVVKFPFSVSRRAHARKPRASKNGTPEERAAQADTEWGQEDESLRPKCGKPIRHGAALM
jgi:hypothetical protein